jgi:hypothetical protein
MHRTYGDMPRRAPREQIAVCSRAENGDDVSWLVQLTLRCMPPLRLIVSDNGSAFLANIHSANCQLSHAVPASTPFEPGHPIRWARCAWHLSVNAGIKKENRYLVTAVATATTEDEYSRRMEELSLVGRPNVGKFTFFPNCG